MSPNTRLTKFSPTLRIAGQLLENNELLNISGIAETANRLGDGLTEAPVFVHFECQPERGKLNLNKELCENLILSLAFLQFLRRIV